MPDSLSRSTAKPHRPAISGDGDSNFYTTGIGITGMCCQERQSIGPLRAIESLFPQYSFREIS
jgi:hypothetical protein